MNKVILFPVRALVAPVCVWTAGRDGRPVARWQLSNERWFAPVADREARPARPERASRRARALLKRAA